MSKKVLYVINSFNYFLLHHRAMADYAACQGYEVHVASSQDCRMIPGEMVSFTFHEIPISRSALNLIDELRCVAAIYTLCKQVKPDLIHNITIKPCIYGSIVARFAGIRFVVNSIMGMGYVFTREGFAGLILRKCITVLYRISFNLSKHKTIFINHDDMDYFVSNKIIKKNDAVVVNGVGVDVNKFHVEKEPEGIPVIILAARMLWDKGIGEYVKAASILKGRHVIARFVLVGDFDEHNRANIAREQVNIWVKQGLVEYWGYSDDMPAIYRKANIVCLPSYREGLGMTLVEAAASGRPLVATDVPGCRDIVRDGDNGLLVPAKEAKAIADALQKLVKNKDMRLKMGQRGRAIAENEYAFDKVVKEIFSVYEGLFN